jgi:hypothetical protein
VSSGWKREQAREQHEDNTKWSGKEREPKSRNKKRGNMQARERYEKRRRREEHKRTESRRGGMLEQEIQGCKGDTFAEGGGVEG